ncbi:hypothetical protein E2C01_083570 [Portunus trituberculatus]|uniref:Uncharacterized protein n=1 Tax=Portunus trituberculatus TaxID=210409 RepID=A0A5B7J8D5_PORTR|nr:hypothetical protein [Portunus trituberculatus]
MWLRREEKEEELGVVVTTCMSLWGRLCWVVAMVVIDGRGCDGGDKEEYCSGGVGGGAAGGSG